MNIRFFHLADIHLGYEQYGSPHRYNDFYQSFERAVDDALQERVDFVLLAGDLFHQRVISPQTLLQAEHQLERLRGASIPVIGVMGNHERPHYRHGASWLDYLAARGLLILLAPLYTSEGVLTFEPYHAGRGGYVDLGNVRIYGLPYYGSITPHVLADAATFLQDAHRTVTPAFTIVITHAGLEGSLPHFTANLTMEHIAPLRPYVNYLALGHVHKPFQKDGWVYNPGSLEPVTLTDVDYPGGAYLVEVNIGSSPTIQAHHRRYAVRPFLRFSLRVSDFASPEALYAGVERHLSAQRGHKDTKPVVEYLLEGVLQFDRHALDLSIIEEMVKAAFNPIVALVRNQTVPAEYEMSDMEQLSRPELEHRVFTNLLARDSRYRDKADEWAKLVGELKQMALEKRKADAIIHHLRANISTMTEGEHADHPH